MKEDSRDPWIRTIAIAFASIGGTSFRGADLTNADFTGATLKSTDFRDFYNNSTKLIRTCWQQVKKLNSVRLGKTYLMNTQVRQLLITGQGQNKNFYRLVLRYVNLHGSNLENTSFIDTDFYQSSLKEANLSRTILVRTNLGKADLRGANLTGSCIQDWVITESTQLDGIICDYVYLKWVNGDKRDQIPPRGKFKEGGFVTFVRYILETVELYHEKDINPRLALTVLKKMSRDYEESLDIVALGKRGERVFIQVKVSENIIRENFKEDYYFRYNSNLKLWSGNIHHFPPTVNSFIEKKITEIALEKADDFVFVDAKYVEGNYTENYQGEVNMSGEHHIQVGRDYRETHVSDEATYVEGDYYNNAESKRILAQVAAEIQQLLEELSQTYPITTTTEQMAVATKAIQQIESNPDLKQKVINAAKEGGLAGFEKAIDNPIGALITGAIKGWLEAKAE